MCALSHLVEVSLVLPLKQFQLLPQLVMALSHACDEDHKAHCLPCLSPASDQWCDAFASVSVEPVSVRVCQCDVCLSHSIMSV